MPSRRPDSEHLEPLTGRQVIAVAAMLKHGAVPAAAPEVGVSERQLRRWVAMPVFKKALRAERRAVMDGVTSRLAAGSAEVVNALLEVIRDKQGAPSARVAAARVWLEHANKAIGESNVSGRLERLEYLTEGLEPEAHDDVDQPDGPRPGGQLRAVGQ